MATYYAKRALEILQEEGPKELVKSGSELAGRKLVGYQIRMENPEDKSAELPKIIEISPQNINWKSSLGRQEIPTKDSTVQKRSTIPKQTVVGVIGGRWDTYKEKWEHSVHHKSLVERFKCGADWEETDIYKRNLTKIKMGETGQHGVSTIPELHERCDEIDRLYQSMKKNGYIPESKLIENPEKNELTDTNPSEVKIRGEIYPSECRIGIGRNGELIRFSAGRHRVSIAKILGLDNMPALLLVRHKEWQELRDEIYNNGLPEGREDLRDHPDLQDILK